MRALFRSLAENPGTPGASAPYGEWHDWSVREPAIFWCGVWLDSGIIAGENPTGVPWERVLLGGDRMAPPDAESGPRWFLGARLNFAENLLRRRDGGHAIRFRGEDGSRRTLTFAELASQAGAVASALTALGVRPGDRVCGYLPNIPEAVVAMLGAAWIGAVWSSCSPDFGAQGVLDRFGQIEPRVLIAADGYRYAGKTIDCRARVEAIAKRLPSVRTTVLVPFAGTGSLPANAIAWPDWIRPHERTPPPPFARLPFDHPLYVMYSSGTTGLPKCLMHGAGGTLIQHLKEHLYHGDLRPDERIFYFTTCGWMMWNWLVSALATGAGIVLYDGAPLPAHNPAMLWDVAAEERVNVFGTSARYLALAEKAGVCPARTHDLPGLRSILSTGSPLAPASFDYVARDVKPGVHLASISGGTDLISCFALGNPLLPVWRGELQARGLGMAVDVFDEHGRPVRGEAGELVCTRPFPSMPVAFWNDPDGSTYRAAYFEHFPGVWRHGDWAEITEHDGVVVYGRSDATLNPGGVRIGTGEIYRIVEQIDDVVESVAVAVEGEGESGRGGERAAIDTGIVLFVRLREGLTLDDDLRGRISLHIRELASPHHVPKLILQVPDIPRTVSGKITEIAVREAFHGRPVKNAGAMANPEALEQFRLLGRKFSGESRD